VSEPDPNLEDYNERDEQGSDALIPLSEARREKMKRDPEFQKKKQELKEALFALQQKNPHLFLKSEMLPDDN